MAQELPRAFAREHDVLLIYPDDQTRLVRESPQLQLYEVQSAGEGDVVFPSMLPGDLKGLTSTLATFQPDIVHAHDVVTLSLMAQIWARRNGVPFVHTAHLLPDRYLDFGATEVLALLDTQVADELTTRALRSFFGGCDAIIALNDAGADSFRRFGYSGRLYVIPNGRDLAHYAELGIADITAPRKRLSFVGWTSRRKNQGFLIEAMTHLPPDMDLQIVGGTLESSYRQEIENRAREHGLQNVSFTGAVDHARIPAILAESHVFVSASKMEVQSLAVIEALASGTPVVGLANETLDELVDDEVGRRLPAGATPAEFADAVRAVLYLPEADYVALCARARARVGRLDWRLVVEQTCHVYQELLDTRSVANARPAEKNGSTVTRGSWLIGAGMAAGSSAVYKIMRRNRKLASRGR